MYSHYCYVVVDDQSIELQFNTEMEPGVGRVYASWNEYLHDDSPFVVSQPISYSNPTYVIVFERKDTETCKTEVRFILEKNQLVCHVVKITDDCESIVGQDTIELSDMDGEDYPCEFNVK